MSDSLPVAQSLGRLSHSGAPGHPSGTSEHTEVSSHPLGLVRYAIAYSNTKWSRTVLFDFIPFLHLVLSPITSH